MERVRNKVKVNWGNSGMILEEGPKTGTYEVSATSRAMLGMAGGGEEMICAHQDQWVNW